MAKERLDKLIASTGRWSRREVKTLVREGRVLVDGRIAGSVEEKYDAESCCIAVNGEELVLRRYTYVMLHKPAGVLSATEDGRGRTVLDLLTPELRKIGVFPVGRLDKDTEGLLLLTDDGELAHALLSPKKHVDKVYYARVSGRLTPEDCAAFEAGMTLGDGLECLPARAGDPRRGRDERMPRHAARGKVSPGQADAGCPRQAGDVFEAPFDGVAAAR